MSPQLVTAIKILENLNYFYLQTISVVFKQY